MNCASIFLWLPFWVSVRRSTWHMWEAKDVWLHISCPERNSKYSLYVFPDHQHSVYKLFKYQSVVKCCFITEQSHSGTHPAVIRVPLNQQRPLVFLRRGTREHGGGRAKCGICLALARLCSGFNLFLGGPIGLLNRNGIFAFLGRPEGCVWCCPSESCMQAACAFVAFIVTCCALNAGLTENCMERSAPWMCLSLSILGLKLWDSSVHVRYIIYILHKWKIKH